MMMPSLLPNTPAMPKLPKFNGALNQTVQEVARQLPGMQRARVSNALKTFDFKEFGLATIPQIMLIYGMCIVSRIYNSWRRSLNELREEITRDGMGFGFWFFVTPMLQRVFLKFCAPSAYKKALLEVKQKPAQGNFANLSLKQKAQVINWHINPLERYSLPSSKQVNEQMRLALEKMEQKGYNNTSKEFVHVQKYYKDLVKWRNYATGLGYLVTIGLLGIGINLYNIHVTKKNMAKKKETAMPQQPVAPMPSVQPFSITPTVQGNLV